MPIETSDFTDEGLLAPKDYAVSFEELRRSLLVGGPPPDSPWRDGWDATWREHLTRQAETLTRQLWQVGIEDVFLDGSFTEAKGRPNDIDGYFTCDAERFASGQLERELNAIDSKSCWTWDPASQRPHGGTRSASFPCGTRTASSCTRIITSFLALRMSEDIH